MQERTMQSDVLEVILESANLFDDSVRVRNNYSGRSMYGTECFGLVLTSESDMYTFLAMAGVIGADRERDEEDGFHTEEAMALARAGRTDSMGRGSTILYFPGWTLDGWTEDGDEDEDI